MLASGWSHETFKRTRVNNSSDVLLSNLKICKIVHMLIVVQNLPEWFVLTQQRSGIHSDKEWNKPTEMHRITPTTALIVKLSNCQLSSIVFIDDDNAHKHLLGSGRQEALLSKTSIRRTVDVKTRGLAVKTSIRRTVDSIGARSMGTSIGVVDQNKKNGASPDDHSSGWSR